MQPTISFIKDYVPFTPRGMCYSPNCMPPLKAVCKVLLSCMQILEKLCMLTMLLAA
jgi:hypothetical protein